MRFIITSLVYQDAIGTIVTFMTLYAVRAVHFEKGQEVNLFMVLTIPAISACSTAAWLTYWFACLNAHAS